MSSSILILLWFELLLIRNVFNMEPNFTSKQELNMDQVLKAYVLNKPNSRLCQNHSKQYENALKHFEPWALKMLDSSSKMQSGILSGNLMEFGNFEECINTKSDRFSGKFCQLKIKLPVDLLKEILKFRNISARRFSKVKILVEDMALIWSVCVPDSCSTFDVHQHFNNNIGELSHIFNLTVCLDDQHCMTDKDSPEMGAVQYATLAFLLTFVVAAIICTTIDRLKAMQCAKNKFVDAFSLISNYRRIMSRGKPGDLDCLHGIRFLSACLVVLGHRYLITILFPISNSFYILDWVLNYSSTIIIGGNVCVDTFFVIGGVLVSMKFFEYVSRNNSFNLPVFYLARVLRLTPALAVVVLIYATLLHFLGSGPLWTDILSKHQRPCQTFWWSTLLHIQNYVNPHALCMLQTWYLTCDMMYYYFSPLILYPLWKFGAYGCINFVFFCVSSIAINFYLAWINGYEGSMAITNHVLESKYFQEHYIAPHVRSSPYLLGLGFGYVLFRLKERKVKLHFLLNIAGWCTAFTCMAFPVLYCRTFQLEDHDFNRLGASMFLSFSRIIWSLGVMWIIWVCRNGSGGIVNYILASHLFRVLGRISYSMFLLHLMFQSFRNAAYKMPIYFSNFAATYDCMGDILFLIIIGFMFTMVFELPMAKLLQLMFSSKKETSLEHKTYNSVII